MFIIINLLHIKQVTTIIAVATDAVQEITSVAIIINDVFIGFLLPFSLIPRHPSRYKNGC